MRKRSAKKLNKKGQNLFRISKPGMNTTLDFKDLPQGDISPMILRSQAVKKDEQIVPTDNMDEEDKSPSQKVSSFSP